MSGPAKIEGPATTEIVKWRDDVPVSGTCAHCGRTDVGTRAAGGVTDGDRVLCKPTVVGRPWCAALVLTFEHPTPCNLCTWPPRDSAC